MTGDVEIGRMFALRKVNMQAYSFFDIGTVVQQGDLLVGKGVASKLLLSERGCVVRFMAFSFLLNMENP